MAYGFVSPGALGGNAIADFLAQRELAERQRMMDALTQQQQAEQSRRADAQLTLQQQQMAAENEMRRRAADDLEQERGFRRASTIADRALPGDVVDEPTRALLEAQGFGSQVRRVPGVVQQGAQVGTMGDDIPLYDVSQSPDSYQMRGGTQYLAGRQAAEERMAALEAQQAAANDRAAADRASREAMAGQADETRRLIAQLGARTDAQSVDLRNQLLALQIEREKATQGAAQDERARAERARTESAQTAINLLDRLEKHPGFPMAYGNISSKFSFASQEAQNAAAIRDQVVAALTLPNLGALKGPMSDKDIVFIKSLATRLSNPNISEAEAKNAIAEARRTLGGQSGRAAAPPPGNNLDPLLDELLGGGNGRP